MFFLIPGLIAFLAGLLQPKDALALLTSLLTLLPTVLSLTNSTLLKALEEDEKAQKRLAASVSFIAVSFPGNWLAGMVFSSLRQEKSLEGWILGLITVLLYALFLVFPYWVSASHLVDILLNVARKGGLLEEATRATPKQEKA